MVKLLTRFVFILVLFGIADCYAQNIQVYASTDTTDYSVGDYIKYRIELRYGKNITPYFPPVKDSVKVLDFIKEEPLIKQETESEVTEIHDFVFSKYDSAGVTIQPIPIEYSVSGDPRRGVIETNPVTIAVHTIPVDPAKDIQDVKSPIKIPLNLILIFILILFGVSLIVGGYFIYRYYRNKKLGILPQKIVVKIPVYKIALDALRDLEEKKLWQQGEVKEYHSQITEIIRKYFEVRFYIPALEIPSSEIFEHLKNINETQTVFDITRNFFDNADLVKFAKFQPMPSVNEEMMKQANDIVLKTKPVEVIEETEEVMVNG